MTETASAPDVSTQAGRERLASQAISLPATAQPRPASGPLGELPAIRQPRYPGATTVVEYEIEASYATDVPGQGGRFSTTVRGHQGVEEALRVFHAIAGTYREGGHLNLIAWAGADRKHAVGLILAQHGWRAPGDDD